MSEPSIPPRPPKSQTQANKVGSELSEIGTIEALQSLPIELKTEIEAAAFRRLIDHLQKRSDVQNIDLMNLAGFCRNCLSKWYRGEAEQKGIQIEDLVVRQRIYGMPYSEWKTKFQK